MWVKTLLLLWVGLLSFSESHAQFDARKVIVEPSAVAARFPAPSPAVLASFRTPAFEPGRSGFTSFAQMQAFLETLGLRPGVRLETLGKTAKGFDLSVLRIGAGLRSSNVATIRPRLLIVGLQHGNEPAGGEAALVLADMLSAKQPELGLDVAVIPRLNPEGAEDFTRGNAAKLDLNRDHLLMRTPEGRALARFSQQFQPHVVLDLHEFTGGGRWLEKFGGWAKYDALLQSANTGNIDEGLRSLSHNSFLPAIRSALDSAGHTSFWYHTTSDSLTDKRVSMGGVQPDTWRNIGGLRHSVSILIETRGVGLGRAHFARRVHSHVLAAQAVITQMLEYGNDLVARIERSRVEAVASACKGRSVVSAEQVLTHTDLTLIDPKQASDVTHNVAWGSALTLDVERERQRACGYVISTAQSPGNKAAIEALQHLGVRVEELHSGAALKGHAYVVEQTQSGQRQDARGAIDDGQDVRLLSVSLKPIEQVAGPGSFFVTMAQPLANLVSAALEPDSQNSYAASRLLTVENAGLLRLSQMPD